MIAEWASGQIGRHSEPNMASRAKIEMRGSLDIMDLVILGLWLLASKATAAIDNLAAAIVLGESGSHGQMLLSNERAAG